jgi:iron complex transport system ATP-binding protein
MTPGKYAPAPAPAPAQNYGAGPQPQAMAPPSLSLRLESVRLNGRLVLEGVQLCIEPGAWVAVVGPNGAGKSTLLKAMAGLLPASGEVALLGRALRDWPARERARQLAWLGQSEADGSELSAAAVVMLGRLPHQAWLAPPSAADHAAVQAAMQQTQCWGWRDRPLHQLSGGERQRVLLARALATQAQVCLMDEPLAHLDPPHQSDWLQTVRQLASQGRTVVAVVHDLNMALLADRLAVLRDGRLIHCGPATEPPTRQALQTAFDHRLHLVHAAGRWMALHEAV